METHPLKTKKRSNKLYLPLLLNISRNNLLHAFMYFHLINSKRFLLFSFLIREIEKKTIHELKKKPLNRINLFMKYYCITQMKKRMHNFSLLK